MELAQLVWLRLRLAFASARSFFRGSRLRVVVLCGAAIVFWMLMFAMFFDAFLFVRNFDALPEAVKQTLIGYLFAFFFFVLLIMMTISSGIICYTSLYRNAEASFLMSLPIEPANVFLHKAAESIAFASWGMAVLVVPLIVAYGLVQHAPWFYYIISVLLAGLFLGIPMSVGAVAALLVPIVLPRRRTAVFVTAGAISAGLAALWGLSLLGGKPTGLFTETGLQAFMGHVAFSQHWAMPSYWVSEGMLSAIRAGAAGEQGLRQAGFPLLLLLSNVLFLGMVATWMGRLLYPRAWARAHVGSGSRGRPRTGRALDAIFGRLLILLPARPRQLVVKDIKTFVRDPVQWSQCLLFFGLLALYVVNMPRLGIAGLEPLWHSMVSLLNLAVTCLTLSTFTSRFVFPQLSLEGRRMWLIGLVPIERSTVLWGKLFFAAAGSMLITAPLIATSDVLLGLPGGIIVIHMVVTASVCFGLNGMAVGLGACYPNMRSDNPAKIVSGFGGTLNLVCSILFIVASIALVAAPLHGLATSPEEGGALLLRAGICTGLDVLLGIGICLLCMSAGVRSFRNMEF